jgi:hypothetical protein
LQLAGETSQVSQRPAKQREFAQSFNGFAKTIFCEFECHLTTAELLVAQSLGDRYRFAFVNTISHEWIDMALSDIISKTRKIYPKWAISF